MLKNISRMSQNKMNLKIELNLIEVVVSGKEF